METTPCDTCPAPCCRNYSVDITFFDAYRIGRTLKMSIEDFTETLWGRKAEENRRIVFADNGRYYRFRLRKVKESEEVKRCVFLLPVAARGICSIYDFRPEICRTYPTYLEGGVLATSGGKYCPEGAWSIERMDVPAIRASWILRRRMQALHDHLVDGWNERVLAMPDDAWQERDLHGYIMSALGEVERRAPEVLERPGPDTPFEDHFTDDRLRDLVDQVLRHLGWRTAETTPFACPEIGRRRKLPMLPSVQVLAARDVTPVELPSRRSQGSAAGGAGASG